MPHLWRRRLLLLLAPVLLGASAAERFPAPERPVAAIVSAEWSDERSRDRAGEAERVIRLLDIRPGMWVGDVGAGAGYYTVRLARRVGPEGRVIAEDIIPETVEALRKRVSDERLGNVDVLLGRPDDAGFAPASLDRLLLVHMYHEIEQPYALLWRLAPSLRPGGRLGIVDSDRDTRRHGTPPALLRCEAAVAGWRQVAFHELRGADSYLAVFEPITPRPSPAAMRPCGARGR